MMYRYLLVLLFLCPLHGHLAAQSIFPTVTVPEEGRRPYWPESALFSRIVFLTGAEDLESVSSQTMERFTALHARPLKINEAGRARMAASGLFSQYQLATLMDYRARHGDILSVLELASIDGFGEAYARAVEPFVDFYSYDLYSPDWNRHLLAGESHCSDGEVKLRGVCGGAVEQWAHRWAEEMRVRYNWKDRLETGLVLSKPAGKVDGPAGRKGFYCTYRGQKQLEQVIVGDFNARFGQGLGLWSGFSIKGFNRYTSFYHRPMGITPSWSSSSSHFKGLAATFGWGRFVLSTGLAFPVWKTRQLHWLPLVNGTCYRRNGQFSVTCFSELAMGNPAPLVRGRVSADFWYTWKGMAFYGEGALDYAQLKGAGVAGISLPCGESVRLSLLGRYYPAGFDARYAAPASSSTRVSDEAGAAFGLDFSGYVLTLDYARHPAESVSAWRLHGSKEWALGSQNSLGLRFSDRLETPSGKNRMNLRLEWKFSYREFLSILRTEAAAGPSDFFRNLGGLAYWETGFLPSQWGAYLRFSLFSIPSWEQRIYVYERDAPGHFNIPAYYGKGFALSLNCQHSFRWRYQVFRVDFRMGTVQYPWNTEKKPGKTELKLQISYRF